MNSSSRGWERSRAHPMHGMTPGTGKQENLRTGSGDPAATLCRRPVRSRRPLTPVSGSTPSSGGKAGRFCTSLRPLVEPESCPTRYEPCQEPLSCGDVFEADGREGPRRLPIEPPAIRRPHPTAVGSHDSGSNRCHGLNLHHGAFTVQGLDAITLAERTDRRRRRNVRQLPHRSVSTSNARVAQGGPSKMDGPELAPSTMNR